MHGISVLLVKLCKLYFLKGLVFINQFYAKYQRDHWGVVFVGQNIEALTLKGHHSTNYIWSFGDWTLLSFVQCLAFACGSLVPVINDIIWAFAFKARRWCQSRMSVHLSVQISSIVHQDRIFHFAGSKNNNILIWLFLIYKISCFVGCEWWEKLMEIMSFDGCSENLSLLYVTSTYYNTNTDTIHSSFKNVCYLH